MVIVKLAAVPVWFMLSISLAFTVQLLLIVTSPVYVLHVLPLFTLICFVNPSVLLGHVTLTFMSWFVGVVVLGFIVIVPNPAMF